MNFNLHRRLPCCCCSTTDYYWLLLTIIDYNWLQLTTTDYYWLLLTTTDYYWLLLTTIDYFWLLLTAIVDYYWRPLIFLLLLWSSQPSACAAAKLLWNAAIRLQQWLAGCQTGNFSQQNLKKGINILQYRENLICWQNLLWLNLWRRNLEEGQGWTSWNWGEQVMQNQMCWQYVPACFIAGNAQCCPTLIVERGRWPTHLASSPARQVLPAYTQSTPINFASWDSDQF